LFISGNLGSAMSALNPKNEPRSREARFAIQI
jgi:hypothetical protein